MASQSGASIVSLFYGRIRDLGYSAADVVRDTATLFKSQMIASEILIGSIRQMQDINEAFLAGADIVTIPAALFPALCKHPKTDEVIGQFMRDFEGWQ